MQISRLVQGFNGLKNLHTYPHNCWEWEPTPTKLLQLAKRGSKLLSHHESWGDVVTVYFDILLTKTLDHWHLASHVTFLIMKICENNGFRNQSGNLKALFLNFDDNLVVRPPHILSQIDHAVSSLRNLFLDQKNLVENTSDVTSVFRYKIININLASN